MSVSFSSSLLVPTSGSTTQLEPIGLAAASGFTDMAVRFQQFLGNAGDPAVSTAGYAKLIYNTVTATLRVSLNGGAFTSLATAAGTTLQIAYDGGASIATSLANGAVTISNTVADNANVLALTKNPAGAQSGNVVNVTLGATTTGHGVFVTRTSGGSGNHIELQGGAGNTIINSTSRNMTVTTTTSGSISVLPASGNNAEIRVAGTSAIEVAADQTNGTIDLDAANFASASTVSTEFAINGTSGANAFVVTQGVNTSGSPTAFRLTGGAHTTLAASTEATDVNLNFARTVQFATGALATQRAMRIQAPTYGFVGASTITDTATVQISGPPIPGTNATLTSSSGLWVAGTHTIAGQTSLRLAPTWNNGAAVLQCLLVNVTNTASAAGSTILDAQVGSSSVFKVTTAGATVTGKLTVTGSIDPTDIQLSGGTDLYFQSADGSTAAVSGANQGRIRYLNGTGWQVSSNTGAYATLATTSGSTWAAVLAAGNTTVGGGTNNPTLSSGDTFQGVDSTTGTALPLRGGNGSAGAGGAATLRSGNSGGTNQAGTATTILGGIGSGTGTPGTVIVQVAPVTTTGTTAQTAATVGTFTNGGALSGSANTGSVLELTASATTTGGPLNGLTITPTWNNTNSTFGALTMAITNTNSATGSNAVNMTNGGVPFFRVFTAATTAMRTTINATGIAINSIFQQSAVNIYADGTPNSMEFYRFNSTAGSSPILKLGKGRGSLTTPSAASSGDSLGAIYFMMYDSGGGDNMNVGAWFEGYRTGSPAITGGISVATVSGGSGGYRWGWQAAGHQVGASTMYLGWAASTDPQAAAEATISKNATGVLQIGTTAANASGSLRLNSLTFASPTIVAGQATWGTGFGAITHVLGPTDQNFKIQSGVSATVGRDLTLAAQNAANGAGGGITATTGNGTTSGAGGTFAVTTGNGAGAAAGGNFTVTTGSGGTGEAGGSFTFTGGGGDNGGSFTVTTGVANATNSSSGEISLTTAAGTTSGSFAGPVSIATGVGGANANGGAFTVALGNGGTGGGTTGGGFSLTTGSSSDGFGGGATMTVGASVGTDRAGSAFTCKAGQGTGNAASGAFTVQGGFPLTSSGTTTHALGDRLLVSGTRTILSTTTATTTTFLTATCATTNSSIGVWVRFTVHVTDGTNAASVTGSFWVAASNTSGTVTAAATTMRDGEDKVTSNTGTYTALTAASAVSVSGTTVNIRITPSWSAGTPTSVTLTCEALGSGPTTLTAAA